MEFKKREDYSDYLFKNGAIRAFIRQLEPDQLWSWVIYLDRVGDHPTTIHSGYGFADFAAAKLDCENYYNPQQKRWDMLNVLYNEIAAETIERGEGEG